MEQLIQEMLKIFLEINKICFTPNEIIKWMKLLAKGILYAKKSLRQKPNDDIEEYLVILKQLRFQFIQKMDNGKSLKRFVRRMLWINIESNEINRLETGIIVSTRNVLSIKEYFKNCQQIFFNKIKKHLSAHTLDVSMSFVCILSKSETPNQFDVKTISTSYAQIDVTTNIKEWYEIFVRKCITDKLIDLLHKMPSLMLINILYLKFNINSSLMMNNNNSPFVDLNKPIDHHNFVDQFNICRNNNCCNYCKTVAFNYHMLYHSKSMCNPILVDTPMECD